MDDPISALLIEGHYSEALPLVLESATQGRRENSFGALLDSLCKLWLIYDGLGQLDNTIAVLEEEVALCRHRGPRELFPESLCSLATALAGVGRMSESLACLRHAQRLLRRQKNPAKLCQALCQEARMLLELGRPKRAEARLRCAPAWPPNEPGGFPHDTLQLGSLLSRCLERQGRLAEAADVLQSALAAPRDGLIFTHFTDLQRLGRLYVRLNQPWEAKVCFHEVLRYLEPWDNSVLSRSVQADLRSLAARLAPPQAKRTTH